MEIRGLFGRVVGPTWLIYELGRADLRFIRSDSEFADGRFVENRLNNVETMAPRKEISTV